MFIQDRLTPTRQRQSHKKIIGFDIETYNDNKNFYCATLFGENINKTFIKKEHLINFFKTNYFQNTYVVATNLGFDFFGTFFGKKDMDNFKFIFRGSDLLSAVVYVKNGKFYRKKPGNTRGQLCFIDTLNFAKLSVEKMGNILNLPKLKKPKALGKWPASEAEKTELISYNIRDAEISYNFMKFLYKSFFKIGASHKITIASTSMSLYRNKYLNNVYFLHPVKILSDIFKGYYGGRVEAFKRGEIRNYNYYDFNSLYPSVMLNEFPNPNTLREANKFNIALIRNYEGMSNVIVSCPDMAYPLLPYRSDNKLLFPVGMFRGWYTHIELRKALKMGYSIIKHFKTYYYEKCCYPFRDFVFDMYDKRLLYKEKNSSMEYIIKILMNSLYGKFGQKFTDRDEWKPFPETLEELDKYENFERVGNMIRIKHSYTNPKGFCIPIWASYVTAYGRLKLYDELEYKNVIYCDTDSIITKDDIGTNTEIGKLKKEMSIKMGVIVKPKFYGFVDNKNNEYVKIKGLGIKLTYDEFLAFLENPSKTYVKFAKFKESLRRHLQPNQSFDITKNLSLEDDKRIWPYNFSIRTLQNSMPRIESFKYTSPLLN